MNAGSVDRRYMTRVIAVANGKGGVGKTSVCSHMGGLCALAGLRTLLVDLDVQGNLAEDLGFVSDDGASMVTALATATPPTVVANVRDNLDVIPGGPMLHGATGILDAVEGSAGRVAAASRLAVVLAPLAAQYDVVLIDCPPGLRKLMAAALVAAQFAIIPTKTDGSSLKGLQEVAGRFTEAREINPGLTLLGVVLFGTTPGATLVMSDARERISRALGGSAPVFTTTIRHVEKVAKTVRDTGQLAYELERMAIDSDAVRRGRQGKPRPAGSVSSLAGDYADLAGEIVPMFTAHVAQLEAAV